AALIIGGAIISKGKEPAAQLAAAPQVSQQAVPGAPTPAPAVQDISFGVTPVVNKGAKVTLVEFGDFQCPFCGQFYTQTFSQLKKDYIDTGKIAYQHRDYPLPFHEHAEKNAEAARCALEQGTSQYWTLSDWMYKNQNTQTVQDLKNAAKAI